MRKTVSLLPTLALWAILGFALSFNPLSATPCRADTGVLKLKVRQCQGTNWLSGAEVDVVIYRPGTGEVDKATGYTDNSGSVAFFFSNLQGADQAHATVTPSGHGSDANHSYTWDQGTADDWDLGLNGDSLCSDGWYDESKNIILCVYNEP